VAGEIVPFPFFHRPPSPQFFVLTPATTDRRSIGFSMVFLNLRSGRGVEKDSLSFAASPHLNVLKIPLLEARFFYAFLCFRYGTGKPFFSLSLPLPFSCRPLVSGPQFPFFLYSLSEREVHLDSDRSPPPMFSGFCSVS